MRYFRYEIRVETYGDVHAGIVEALDLADAKRLLRVKYLQTILLPGTVIKEVSDPQQRDKDEKSERLHGILLVLSSHYRWQRGEDDGQRADLSGRDLRGLQLGGIDLSDADLSDIDFSRADLRGANFHNAKLTQAILAGARLDGADLGMADLTDADLRDASLVDASLDGADLWRANLMGVTIAPEALHAALGCRLPEEQGKKQGKGRAAKKAGKKKPAKKAG